MLIPSSRTFPILVVVTVLVASGFATAGVAFDGPTDDPETDRYGIERAESTATAPDHSSPDPLERSSGTAADHSSTNPSDHSSTDPSDHQTRNALDQSSSDTVRSAASVTVTSVVFLAGHDREDGSDPLDHDVRSTIHEAIDDSSGMYFAQLRETVDVHRSTLRYHLDVLERAALLSSETIFGQRWYHLPGSDGTELRAALAADALADVLEAVARLEPATVTALADEVDRADSTVSYHLDRLEREGLIERERLRSTTLLRMSPEVRAELESADSTDER